MKSLNTDRDLLMDALLKQHAKGGPDEVFLAELESSIDGEEGAATTPAPRRKVSKAVLAWAALLVASVAAIFGVANHLTKESGENNPGIANGTGALPAERADFAQAMRLRVEEVVSRQDQTPARISFTYLLDGRHVTETFARGVNWPEADSPEGASFPFHSEKLPVGRPGLAVYLERLPEYLGTAGADPPAVNDSLYVTLNTENGDIAEPSLPSQGTDLALILRDAEDLTGFSEGFSCATLLCTYFTNDVNIVPRETTPAGEAVYPRMSFVAPEKRLGLQPEPIPLPIGASVGEWFKPGGTLSGFDPMTRYSNIPPITVDLRSLPPKSRTYVRAYRGSRSKDAEHAFTLPRSEMEVAGPDPVSRRIVLQDVDEHFKKEGPYTIEIVQETSSGTEVLDRKSIRADRTIEVNATVYIDPPVRAGRRANPRSVQVPTAGSRHLIPSSGRRLDPTAVEGQLDSERYGQLVDQPWKTPWKAPLSTFSVDVDTASYTNIRRMLRDGNSIPKDAVRLEECLNYFDYAYAPPVHGGPFAVHVDLASCPWQERHLLAKIGIKGREVDNHNRPPSNLVFLIDVSGSMRTGDKLPLLVESMKTLVEELDERDTVGIVVYAGSAGTILEPTRVAGGDRKRIVEALDRLSAGGSTAGAAGIRGAYELAARHYRKDGVNRVILATDGDFNVGTSGTGELVELVKEQASSGVYLSVLGFGTGNLNDGMMEAITNDGNGNYFYIDSKREGRKVFLQNLSGTLVTIAKDVKLQVEFNPAKVAGYRLIGYANRILRDEDFNNDKVDAGDIGAGHTVTALYEIVPVGVALPNIGGVDPLKYQAPAGRVVGGSPEWMTVKLRYKKPDGDQSSLLTVPVEAGPIDWRQASPDYVFAAAVALFGEKLRGSDKINGASWKDLGELVMRGAGADRHGHRSEFLELVGLAAARHPDQALEGDLLDGGERSGAVEAPPAE